MEMKAKGTYAMRVDVAPDVPQAYRRLFRHRVMRILRDDPNGWASSGYRFVSRRLPHDGVCRVTLTGPRGIGQACSEIATHMSCYHGGLDRVFINAERWAWAAEPFLAHPDRPTLQDYRTYVVNHEVGHWLGRGHDQRCRPLSPVMKQQTLGFEPGCQLNVHPLAGE